MTNDDDSPITTQSLLKEALSALSAKFCRCRKCGYVWKPNYKAKRKLKKAKKCPACMQTNWETGWVTARHNDRSADPAKETRYGGRKECAKRSLKLMREELAERAILLREGERLEREARVRELMRRIDRGTEGEK